MNLFARKKNRIDKLKNEEKEVKYEERTPNHWTYSDDPLLNMDPIFTDDPYANKQTIEDIAKQYSTNNQNQENDISINDKITQIKKNLGINKTTKKTGGVLDSIIDGARKKTQDIQNKILEIDPVIAKLQKIEELKRTGGTDANLYTDVNKIKNQSISYAQRAKEFQQKNGSKPIESLLERARRLLKEVQQQREQQQKTQKVLENREQFNQNNENENNLFQAVSKSQLFKSKSFEQKIKDKIIELKNEEVKTIELEAKKTLQELDEKIFFNDLSKEEYYEKKLKEFEKKIKNNKKISSKSSIDGLEKIQNKKK